MKRTYKKSVMKIDPAPSRVSYLLTRIWLRNSSRLSALIIIPMLVLVFILMSLNYKYNLQGLIKNNFYNFSEFIALSPAFKVVDLSIISDSPPVVEKIKSNLALKFPISSLDINVVELKARIEGISLVRSASVRLTSNGLIEVIAVAREPIVMHRIGERLILLDEAGVEVDEVMSRSQRLDLPLLVGKGAEYKVKEALQLLIETQNLILRVRGLVRIGERRWDVILDRDQVIKLPEENPVIAMKKIISLHEGRSLFDRDIIYLDFRNTSRPILGLSDGATQELRNLRNLVRGENV